MVALAEDRRPALGGAADRDRVRPGVFEHPLRLLRRLDVALGDYRDGHRALHPANDVVLRVAVVHAGPRAAVHGERADAVIFRELRLTQVVSIVLFPASAYL